VKKVLIITYYWPPAGGVEVLRTAKFCKYLSYYGWEPVILTVRGGNYRNRDEELGRQVNHVKHVFKAPTLEPHSLYYRLAGSRSKSSAPAKVGKQANRLGEFIRLNLFIPDSRIGWYHGAVKLGKEIIRQLAPDVIFSTAPPYTPHLIASKLHTVSKLPWVADFRDPWVENYAYNTTYRFPWVKWLNERLERKVLHAADRVLTATPGQLILQSEKVSPQERSKFTTITNGHDLGETLPEKSEAPRFYISYYGWMNKSRIPSGLVSVLSELIKEEPEFGERFTLRLAGRIDFAAEEFLRSAVPAENLEIWPQIPHDELMLKLFEEQLFLTSVDKLPHNELILTSKIFELLPTGNPILGLGPVSGNTAEVLRETAAGDMFDYDDQAGIRVFVWHKYECWKAGTLNTGQRRFPEYERRQLTERLADIFDVLISE